MCSLFESKAPPPPPIVISTHAPTCLLSFNSLKEFIQPKLSCCPVCKNANRRLKDRDADSLEHSLFIECKICESKDLELRYSINNLRKVLLQNLRHKDRKQILNRLLRKKRSWLISEKVEQEPVVQEKKDIKN